MEENIKILEEFINNEFQKDKLEMNEKGGFKIGTIYKVTELSPAIENLIKDYRDGEDIIKKTVKENLELKKYIRELEEKLNTSISSCCELFEFIPKSKIKEIRDKAEVMDYYTLPDVIEDLEKLLEDK